MARQRKNAKKLNMDYEADIAQKCDEKEKLNGEIVQIKNEIEGLKAQLKAKKAMVKKLDKAIAKIREQRASAEAEAALEMQKQEAESLVLQLLSSGMTSAEILERLK